MEIHIFKKEISQEIFKHELLYRYVNVCNVELLKNEQFGNFRDLDKTKNALDYLDKNMEKHRRATAKYLHEYELVKFICKKQVISRAYFKLYEMIYYEPIVSFTNLDCFFICEAPGGFIECISDIRRKKNLRTNFISISKYDPFIKYSSYLEENNLLYGDITDINCIDKTVDTVLQRYPNKLQLITADGGFDIKFFSGQEILTSKLLLCEIYLALRTQSINGMFIIKVFDMFCHNTIVYYLILCSCYERVKIIKPKTSRNCNSERYFICYNFKGITAELLYALRLIIQHYYIDINLGNYTIVFPNLNFSMFSEISRIKIINNLIVHEQIKTINESLKMISCKDYYIQNLLIGIFSENKNTFYFHLNNTNICKNLLQSRVKKCIDFLRNYNINLNHYFLKNFK
jgi:23S rRNA U2552 (ribose-2'-O)-methylase RlmE/FtsJ